MVTHDITSINFNGARTNLTHSNEVIYEQREKCLEITEKKIIFSTLVILEVGKQKKFSLF